VQSGCGWPPTRSAAGSVTDDDNNNNNNRDDIYGGVIRAKPLREFTGSFDECRLSAEVAADPQTEPTVWWHVCGFSAVLINTFSAHVVNGELSAYWVTHNVLCLSVCSSSPLAVGITDGLCQRFVISAQETVWLTLVRQIPPKHRSHLVLSAGLWFLPYFTGILRRLLVAVFSKQIFRFLADFEVTGLWRVVSFSVCNK